MIDFVKRIIKGYIKDSQYKKNVLVMIVGRTVAQVIPIFLTPLLTRIYSPGDFGIFGVFATVVSIVAMVSNGRYCLSIVLPKDDEKAKRLFLLSSFLSILTTVVFAVVLIIWGEGFFSLLNTTSLIQYLWIIILNILFVALYEDLYYYALRMKAFKLLTTNIIIQALVLVISRLAFGYLGYTGIGLILSYLLGYAISYILMIVRLKMPVYGLIKEFKMGIYWQLMKEYYKFPKYSLLADTLSVTANMSPNIFLNKIFGSITTGYYSMTDKILGSPIWLVTSAVGDVFRQEASEQFREKGSCFEIFKKTVKTMFLFGIIPFGLLFIFSPYVIPFLLGAEWEPVGNYIRIFSIMYFIRFIVRPVSFVIYIIRKQNVNVIFQVINLASIMLAFFIGFITKNLSLCLISWSILSSIAYLVVLIYSYKFAKEIKYDSQEDQ